MIEGERQQRTSMLRHCPYQPDTVLAVSSGTPSPSSSESSYQVGGTGGRGLKREMRGERDERQLQGVFFGDEPLTCMSTKSEKLSATVRMVDLRS